MSRQIERFTIDIVRKQDLCPRGTLYGMAATLSMSTPGSTDQSRGCVLWDSTVEIHPDEMRSRLAQLTEAMLREINRTLDKACPEAPIHVHRKEVPS